MRRLLAAAAAAVLLAGCGATPTGTAADRSLEPEAAVSGDAPGAVAPAAVARRTGALVPRDPSSLVLPDGTSVPVRAVSTTRNGVLDVPPDVEHAGWWRGGSRLGDPFGSSLVAAHVDSREQGLGPFADLLTVSQGARVVLRGGGLQQTFEVSTLRLRPRGTIAADSWLHSPAGDRRLVLVTCAPPYVVTEGGYQNLAIVVATPVGEPVRRAAP